LCEDVDAEGPDLDALASAVLQKAGKPDADEKQLKYTRQALELWAEKSGGSVTTDAFWLHWDGNACRVVCSCGKSEAAGSDNQFLRNFRNRHLACDHVWQV
jgi:hypothetical protein